MLGALFPEPHAHNENESREQFNFCLAHRLHHSAYYLQNLSS